MPCTDLQNIIDKFNVFTQKPAKFLTVQDDVREEIKNLVKSVYDFTKSQEENKKKSNSSALPDLIVKDFDEEQIWQEIELQNTQCWDNLVWDVANSITTKDDLKFPIKEPENSTDDPDDSANDPDDSDEAETCESDAEKDQNEENTQLKIKKAQRSKQKHKTSKTSVVDDQFFKLQDMEKFLVNQEKNDNKPKKVKEDSDEESIDMFDEIDSEASDEEEGGGKEMMYSDFFNKESGDDEGQDDISEKKRNKKKDRKVTFADEESDSEGDDDEQENEMSDDGNEPNTDKITIQSKPAKNEKPSDFELRQQRLQQQISRLEEKTISDAPWQLRGEVDATKRPQNSLLQEVVDFDLTTRPPPIITEQTTVTLEQIIRQRVKDKAWDDVAKKQKPVDDVLAFRKAEVLDHSKSKQSLAQVYEAEYLKQKHASTDDIDDEKEPEEHKQIREAISSLFSKLDALSHYHYTPKAVQPEVKIVSNTPAISMEEVAPIAASNATLLAPEEVKKKRKGELTSKEERTDTDKRRERRKKKKFQKGKNKVEKVTEQRNTKKGVEVNHDKSLKTSKAFFQQLNDDSTSLIKSSNAKRKNVKNKGQ